MFIFLLIFLLLFFLSVKKKTNIWYKCMQGLILFGLLLLVFWGVSSLLTINYGNIFTIYLLVCYLLISFLYLLFYAWFKKRQFSPYVEIDKDTLHLIQERNRLLSTYSTIIKKNVAVPSQAVKPREKPIPVMPEPGQTSQPTNPQPTNPQPIKPQTTESRGFRNRLSIILSSIIAVLLIVIFCMGLKIVTQKQEIASLESEVRMAWWQVTEKGEKYEQALEAAEMEMDLIEDIYPWLLTCANNFSFNDEKRYYHGYYCSELGNITGCATRNDYERIYYYGACPVCGGFDQKSDEILSEVGALISDKIDAERERESRALELRYQKELRR